MKVLCSTYESSLHIFYDKDIQKFLEKLTICIYLK